MKADYQIVSFAREQKKVKQQQKADKQTRYNYLKEFRESLCDMFDMADFYYYAENIGCNVSYLLNCARYSTDSNYQRRPRSLSFRRQFYIENGHSITKHNPLFSN